MITSELCTPETSIGVAEKCELAQQLTAVSAHTSTGDRRPARWRQLAVWDTLRSAPAGALGAMLGGVVNVELDLEFIEP